MRSRVSDNVISVRDIDAGSENKKPSPSIMTQDRKSANTFKGLLGKNRLSIPAMWIVPLTGDYGAPNRGRWNASDQELGSGASAGV
jgi:hypothetical protein